MNSSAAFHPSMSVMGYVLLLLLCRIRILSLLMLLGA
jgi:hypothetical protein